MPKTARTERRAGAPAIRIPPGRAGYLRTLRDGAAALTRRRAYVELIEAERSSPQEVVRVLAALSEFNRYRIVDLLSADGVELSCGAVGSALGLSASLVSHHLSVLESAGVIDRRRNGLWTLNRLRREELSRRLAGLQRILRPDPS